MSQTSYIVTVRMMVNEHSDDYLQSVQAITEEFASWLEGLRAIVHEVDVRPAERKERS